MQNIALENTEKYHVAKHSATQDTATQAMTEVALGLSMAFFALLILALISIGLPVNSTPHQATDLISSGKLIKDTLTLSDAKPSTLKTQNQAINSSSSLDIPTQTIALFWQGNYYDIDMKNTSIAEIIDEHVKHQSSSKKLARLIVAVPPLTSFHDLLAIQGAFKPHTIQVTKITPEWERAFLNQAKSKSKVQNEK